MLKQFKMDNFKKDFLPYKHGLHLSKDMYMEIDEEIQRMHSVPYASVVGSLMCGMLCTMPDIACYKFFKQLSIQFRGKALVSCKDHFKYLRRIKDLMLNYECSKLNI